MKKSEDESNRRPPLALVENSSSLSSCQTMVNATAETNSGASRRPTDASIRSNSMPVDGEQRLKNVRWQKSLDSFKPKTYDGRYRAKFAGEEDRLFDGQQSAKLSHQNRQMLVRPSLDSSTGGVSLDVQCGIGPYRPLCLQKFAEKNWMLFWLCWFCAVQGMLVSGLVPSVLTTIERRFNFRSASLGRIMQWYDIGYALCCVPVSYFGGRHSKPLFIGLGLLIMGVGSFAFSLPHIISGAHIARQRSEDIGSCIGKPSDSWSPTEGSKLNLSTTIKCDSSEDSSFFAGNIRYEILFSIAHLLHGIGATPLFTLGVSYIDENVKPTLSSLYIAIFYTFVIIGPAAGFLMSSFSLRYHADFLSTEKTSDFIDIDESNPDWVGAWWIGFQIAAILSLFAVFPLLSFPKALPSALEWQKTRMRRKINAVGCNEASEGGAPTVAKHPSTCSNNEPSTSGATAAFAIEPNVDEAKQTPLWRRLVSDCKHIPSSVHRLISNPTYMCITLAASVEGLLITGYSGFMGKYLERQFNVASSRANMLIGCIMVPVAGLGTLASGYVVKRFRLTCAKTLKYCIAMALFSLVLSPMFLVLCDPAKLAGTQIPYPLDDKPNQSPNNLSRFLVTSRESFDLRSRCNDHCSCLDNGFHPVCGSVNGRQFAFFSSCFAGCPEQYHPLKRLYQNCTCVDNGDEVTAGWCESKCSALIGFLILFAPMCLCTFSIGVPALSIILRCVDYNERSFALGIQWILIRCIGTIPAPAIFAWLFDTSCLIRRSDKKVGCASTGSDGSCYVNDGKLLADLFLAFALIGQTVTLVFLVLALVSYKSNGRDDLIASEAPQAEDNYIDGELAVSQDHPTVLEGARRL